MHHNSLALPQSIGIGSVAGPALGTMLMAYAGCGEAAVYVCAAVCGCLFPLAVGRVRLVLARARRVDGCKGGIWWRNARIEALGR